jgi:hypothetical protein
MWWHMSSIPAIQKAELGGRSCLVRMSSGWFFLSKDLISNHHCYKCQSNSFGLVMDSAETDKSYYYEQRIIFPSWQVPVSTRCPGPGADNLMIPDWIVVSRVCVLAQSILKAPNK